jgi:hypothetical protein
MRTLHSTLLLLPFLVACSGSPSSSPDPGVGAVDAAPDAHVTEEDAPLDSSDALSDPGEDSEADSASDGGTTPDVSTDSHDANDEPDADASESDADSSTDTDAIGDMSVPDADASTDADAIGDASDAAPDPDASVPDVGTECSYLDLSIWIVDCDGGYRYLREWTDIDGASAEECPAVYTIMMEFAFTNARDALESDGCNPDCLAAAATSVSYLRCGRRSGYIIYRSDTSECPELYEFSEGIYESFEEYDEANPCP